MNKNSLHILRIGLAITFVWIGVSILRHPEVWMGYMQPWAVKLMPFPIEGAMKATAYLDILVGGMLLFNFLTWLAALVGVLHLISVLVVSGITDITVRDIGVLGGAMALFYEIMPEKLARKFKK